LIDAISKRYGILPSQLLREADTLDVHVINTATAWEQYQAEKAQTGRGVASTPTIPVEKLQQMMDKVKRKKHGNKKSA
jgi:hypothetical protein